MVTTFFNAFGTAVVILLFGLASPLAAERIPFEVCVDLNTWVRPSPDIQSKVWNDPRYKDFARDAYAWTHNFILIDDPLSTSVAGMFSNLSGLWTAEANAEVIDKCSSGPERRSGFEWIDVWVLLHRVKAVDREANTYTVTVEPTDKGFQKIFIRRLNPSAVLRFVTLDGREIERWDESAPPKQFTNNVPARAVIRDANGRLIQK